MSENLSLDEIIKRAEKIKQEAETQLAQAEKALDEKTKTPIDDVVVDKTIVVERVAKVYEKIEAQEEEEDVKEFIPSKKDMREVKIFTKAKKQPVKIEEEDDNEDIKIADEPSRTQTINLSDKREESTRIVSLDKEEAQTRPMAFVSKSKVDKKSDLQEIPTIVAREHIYNGFTADASKEEFEEDIGVQMCLEGFDDTMETVPTIDENVAEQILEERRREKVGKFRLFGPDETDMELGNNNLVDEDYESEQEKSDFERSLLTKKSAVQTKLLLTLILGVPLFCLTVFKDSAYFPSALSGHKPYFLTALLFYGAILLTNLNIITHGLQVKKSINFDFPLSITAILVLVHSILLCADTSLWIDNGILLPSAVTFALLMSQLGKRKMLMRILDNFHFITSLEDKYTIENIVNTVDAEVITRGLIAEKPVIKTSIKTDFPTNFLEISCKNEPADKTAKVMFPLALFLSTALLVAVGINDNFNSAINTALCALVMAFPVGSLYLTNSLLSDISLNLKGYGSRVCGCEGAVMAYDANTMVIEAADLFGINSCEIHGIKTFNGAKVDDAILQAAAIMLQTKSPLSHVFDSVIIGKQSILPVVEGVTYEEKMGTSAWIYKRKVLVGNRDLLLTHGVRVPKESFEKKYTVKGRSALYLAVDGDIQAMFVVSYSAEPELKRELRKLEKSGITIIVKSSDPYINEQSLAALFGVPEGFIRVMNYSAAKVFDKYSNMHVEKSPAYVVHNGTALGFVSAMRAAEIIVSLQKLISFLSIFGAVMGLVVVAMLSLLGAYSQITVFSVIAFQTIWSVFMLLLSKIKSFSL